MNFIIFTNNSIENDYVWKLADIYSKASDILKQINKKLLRITWISLLNELFYNEFNIFFCKLFDEKNTLLFEGNSFDSILLRSLSMKTWINIKILNKE